MAVAVLSKKKLKNRSSQRSPSSRTLEDVDEDAAIISLLENEPWQPDLLLERRSDKSTSDLGSFQSTALSLSLGSTEKAITSNTSKNPHYSNGHSNENVNTGTGHKASGFQGMIPVIIKSPSSITSGVADTITESDYVESIADVDNDQPIVVSPAKIRGIEEYLQQTHQEQQLLQQQQQEIQMQLQMQKERDRERGKEREREKENVREKARTGGKERGTETPPMKLQLQYQLPAHLQIMSGSDQTIYPPHIQQHRNSYHGAVQSSSKELFSGLEERTSPLAPAHTLTSRGKASESVMVTDDNEDVVESLESLKHITMLALDGLLQQVVSDVTASDPIHNADETTLQARALIRRRSIPLLDLAGNEDLTTTTLTGTTAAVENNKHSISLRNPPSARKSISDTPIASMATSSLERLDELARKVDQLAAAAADEQQNQQQLQGLNGTLPSSPSGNVGHILHEPLEIPVRRQDQLFAQGQQLDPPQVFESEEYQLACALAAMLACIYRILDHMQQPRHNEREQAHLTERPRHPQRTESVDSGLDQASKLWKRLSSNSSARNPLRPSASLPIYAITTKVSASKTIMGPHISSSPERKVLAEHEISPRSSSPAANGTGGFMQTINKQVRTLRSRRSQSTSHIEVSTNRHGTKSLHVRLLSGFQVGSNSKTTTPTGNHGSFHTEAGLRSEEAKELELEWSELDKLMDEMTRLWRSVESSEQQQQSSEEESGLSAKVDTDEDNENNPFHDRHQVQSHQQEQQQQQRRQQGLQSPISPLKMGAHYTMSPTQEKNFDQQTLEMSTEDDLPQYDDDAPEYILDEKATDQLLPSRNVRSRLTSSLISRTSRGVRSLAGNHSRTGGVVDDEKTRFDLNNVMSAIERLSKVAPRLDNQRVQLSPSQRKHKARAGFAHTIERLSRDRWDFQFGSSSASASSSSNRAATKKREAKDKHRDLDKLVNQIVECANKTSSSSYTTAQRAEFSPKQQWKLECARERGEKMRMSDQDWHSPEKVLLKDMTRLTNTLYQQSASSRAFDTQRFTLTEDKARNMALQGIISKIERVSSRRMGNQDAASSSLRSKSASPSLTRTACRESSSSSSSDRVKELQDMINQVMESGGGPTRKSAMASQRAEFSPKN